MLILVTNDDGILSPGIRVLADTLKSVAEVVVVAPDRERSAVSHSLTLHSPLRAEEIEPDFFAIDGTPTDCVNLGVHGLLPRKPDLVVSGINRGGNIGDDITYSGTVSAAMEATLMGVPAFAVSLVSGPFLREHFRFAAQFSKRLVLFLGEHGLPKETLLNVNIPAGQPRGLAITRQGKRRYGELVVEKVDPRGKKYYWIGGEDLGFENEEGTDAAATAKDLVSITPLHLDLTNYRSLEMLQAWPLENFDSGFVPPPNDQEGE